LHRALCAIGGPGADGMVDAGQKLIGSLEYVEQAVRLDKRVAPHLRSFSSTFIFLTGYSPMSWQSRLFDQFTTGWIPTSLDLPTGLGKTSVIAIWLAARALAKEDVLKTIPRRLVYVVDRRAVVDQATEEAEKLRKALEGDAKHLKESLRLDGSTLPISTLRGAHVDNREWLEDPTAPAIVVGTVDIIGSRLLFEGYGVSRKMRPYHAGLLGADTLIVLDEAHLVPPFEALLRSIAGGASEFRPRAKGDREIVPPFKLLSLSATIRSRPVSDGSGEELAFRLEDEDFSDPVVKKRLAAKKAINFVKIDGEKDALVEALAKEAWKLSGEGSKLVRCLVYCDSRAIAEKVKEKLDSLAVPDKKASEAKADTELFVGSRRVKERGDAKDWLQSHGFLAGSGSPAKPAFLIATSAGEVGVDLNADHMVCDLVPWERMVQRLGRVNRRGEGDATIVVVHGDGSKPKKPEAPTDQERRQAIGFRSLAVLNELPDADNGNDASPGALRELKLRVEVDKTLGGKIAAALTPEPLRPALTRALVDAWSMTSLEHHTGRPEVAPWLRGWVSDDPQTMVIWRAYLPVRESVAEWPRASVEKKEIEEFFEAAPPHESEKLETETHRVAGWLQNRAKALLKPEQVALKERAEGEDINPEPLATDDIDPDKAEAQPTAPQTNRLRRNDIVAFAISPDGGYAARYTLGSLAQERKGKARDDFHDELVGKILVVDTRFGGLTDGMLDDKGKNDLSTVDASDDWSREAGFRVRPSSLEEEEEKEKGDRQDWRFEAEFVLRRDDDGAPVERLIIEHFRGGAQREDARSISKPQELAEHQSRAEQKARQIAAKVGLCGHAAEALALSALLHDEGKKAPRWQRAFRASRDATTYGLSGPLAKTRGPINQAILDGYRHEFGSLPYAEANARFKDLPEHWRDLVQHLIAAHHGQARPVIETRGCEGAPPSALEERARDVAMRFARLQKRWGPSGLAWWEALLRAADHEASRDNDVSVEAIAPHMEKI
jgi:CRISPR-associated endonuclease/helicase Cas3